MHTNSGHEMIHDEPFIIRTLSDVIGMSRSDMATKVANNANRVLHKWNVM